MKESSFIPHMAQEPRAHEGSLDRDFEEFYAQHKKFFEYYAKDGSINVTSHLELPQSQQGTFVIDLKNGKMYVAMDVFKKAGYGDEASFFAFLHEYEHFRELRELMQYQNVQGEQGVTIWKKHYQKLLKSKGLQILDNCIDDIKMNRTVLERAPTMTETKDILYKTFNFPEDNLQNQPLHLQLAYALLRRRMLPNNETIVDKRVEVILQKIENISIGDRNLIDVMTSPETNMANRLKLQEAFIEPEFLKLLEQAKQEQQNKDKEKQKQNKNSNNQNKKEDQSSDKDTLDKDQKDSENSSQEGQEAEGNSSAGKKESFENKKEEELFKEAYQEYTEKNPQATTIQSINQSIQEFEKNSGNGKSIEEMQLEALAKKEGISIADMKEYQNFWSEIENLENPDTGEKIVDELRSIFKKIITKRTPPRQTLVSNLEEGNEIEDYTAIVAGAKTGNFDTKIWQDFEKINRPHRMVGNFDVSFVCDRSGSMQGEKLIQERIAVGLFLEMLKEFSEDLESAPIDPQNRLEVKTEVWGFGDENQVRIIKPLNEELSEKDRIMVHKTLGSAPGDSTLDYRPLEEISNALENDILEKIEKGEQRKIVILVTDGESSSPARLRGVVEDLRSKGVVVVAIGVGDDAGSVEANYAPQGILCKDPKELGVVVGDLLKDFLEAL